jgi:hypothetical protein
MWTISVGVTFIVTHNTPFAFNLLSGNYFRSRIQVTLKPIIQEQEYKQKLSIVKQGISTLLH